MSPTKWVYLKILQKKKKIHCKIYAVKKITVDISSFCRESKKFFCENECLTLNDYCKNSNCLLKNEWNCKKFWKRECYVAYNSMGSLNKSIVFPFQTIYGCNKNKCGKGHFLCSQLKFCIEMEMVCDGLNHCYNNEDETGCQDFTYQNLYKCRNQSRGIMMRKVCDSKVDCRYGDDEMHCFDNINYAHNYCEFVNSVLLYCDCRKRKKNYQINFVEKRIMQLKIIEKCAQLNISNNHSNILYFSAIRNNGNFSKIIQFFPNLISLILKRNRMTFETINNVNLPLLQNLDLSFNTIKTLNWIGKLKVERLLYLDLSENPLKFLNLISEFVPNLRILKILKCPFLYFGEKFFSHLSNLKILRIDDTVEFTIANYQSLKNLRNLKKIISKSFSFCCLIWKFTDSRNRDCSPKTTLYSSCSNLLSSLTLKILCWFFGLTGIILNISSGICTFFTESSIKLYKYSLIGNDFFATSFFVLLASVDLFYNGVYIENEKSWRESHVCWLSGTLLQFSLASTSITLFLLTCERFEAIKHPFKESKIKKWRPIILTLSLSIALIISMLPNFIYQVSSVFYFQFK